MAEVVTFVKTARAGLARAGIARAGFAPASVPHLTDDGANNRIYIHQHVASPVPPPAHTVVVNP